MTSPDPEKPKPYRLLLLKDGVVTEVAVGDVIEAMQVWHHARADGALFASGYAASRGTPLGKWVDPGAAGEDGEQAAKPSGQAACSPWTPERIEILRRMWLAGHRRDDIAAELGPWATHNAVTGKINRLGLYGHPDRVSLHRPHKPDPEKGNAKGDADRPLAEAAVA